MLNNRKLIAHLSGLLGEGWLIAGELESKERTYLNGYPSVTLVELTLLFHRNSIFGKDSCTLLQGERYVKAATLQCDSRGTTVSIDIAPALVPGELQDD